MRSLFQVGPIYLGAKAVRAWREITNSRLRLVSGTTTTQDALEDFVALVADVKHFIHFEALFEGGPQLVLQSILIIRDWDERQLSVKLSDLEVSAWVRVISPLISAGGLVFAQLDFLCENDRFIHRIWQRDHPAVMLAALVDLSGQLLMRVIPLVVLCNGVTPLYSIFGWVTMSIGIVAAFGVTWSVLVHPNEDQHWQDLATNSFLFWPHNFFFATTYFPGKKVRQPGEHPFQTTQRALVSKRGLRLSVFHTIFTGCAALPTATPTWRTSC